MDPAVRQAQRIQAGIEATQDAVNPGWLLQLNTSLTGSVNMHDGYTHYTSEAVADSNQVLTQDRRIYQALMNSGLYSSSTQRNVGTYMKAALALNPVSYWRLGETGGNRVAVDLVGGQFVNLVTNPNFEADLGFPTARGNATPGIWNTGAATPGIQVGAAVSISTAQHFVDSQSMQITTTGSPVSQGVGYAFDDHAGGTDVWFQAGQPYTFSLYMKGNAGGESVQIFLGENGLNGQSPDYLNTTITLTNAWQRYTLTWTPTGTRNGVGITIRAPGALAQTWFVDAVMVTRGATAPGSFYGGNGGNDGDYLGSFVPNLLVQGGWPSFEAGVTNMVCDGGGTVTQWTVSFNGTHGAKVSAGATTPSAMDLYASGPKVAVVPNTVYTLSAYSQPVLAGQARNFHVDFQWYDGTGTQIGGNIYGPVSTEVGGAWTRAVNTATSPANAATVLPVVRWDGVTTAGEQHYVDAGQMTATPNAVPYSDTTGIQLGQPGAVSGGGDTNTAVQFDGQSGWVKVPYDSSMPSVAGYWVAAWINPQALLVAGSSTIAAFSSSWPNNGWWFKLTGAGYTQLTIGHMDGSEHPLSSAGGAITLGAWQHVLATYDGTTATLYVNAIQKAQSALATPTVVPSNGVFAIGGWISPTSNDFYAGKMDEVLWGPGTLSAAQVQNLYNSR